MKVVGGRWRGVTLCAPRGRACRPTLARVREALFDRIGTRLTGALIVDLFAGSGALGLEALSRGARHAVFVEESAAALRVLRANIAALKAESLTDLVAADAYEFLRGRGGRTDGVGVLFADPPYASVDPAFAVSVTAASGLGWAPRALLVVETGAREPELDSPPGWWRWPGRVYGDVRITIDERGEQDE